MMIKRRIEKREEKKEENEFEKVEKKGGRIE
jgi:hypothetical protein